MLFSDASYADDVKLEQALRARVEEFYSFLQAGQLAEAEQYVAEDSKANFRNRPRSLFMDPQLDSVKIDPDGQNASVGVKMQVFTHFSAKPVPVNSVTRWRLVDGAWYLLVPKPEATDIRAMFGPQPGRGATPITPEQEQLKFKGHRYMLGHVQPGQVKVARFPFTNVTDHEVKITAVQTGCDCLKVKTEKKVYKPGESGELAIEFSAGGREFEYLQTIIVRTDPGNLMTHLNISGYLLPPPRPAPQPDQDTLRDEPARNPNPAKKP